VSKELASRHPGEIGADDDARFDHADEEIGDRGEALDARDAQATGEPDCEEANQGLDPTQVIEHAEQTAHEDDDRENPEGKAVSDRHERAEQESCARLGPLDDQRDRDLDVPEEDVAQGCSEEQPGEGELRHDAGKNRPAIDSGPVYRSEPCDSEQHHESDRRHSSQPDFAHSSPPENPLISSLAAATGSCAAATTEMTANPATPASRSESRRLGVIPPIAISGRGAAS
jgi:hypothetical protein